MPGGGDPRDRAAADVGGEVDFAGRPAPGAAQRFSARPTARILVIQPCPLCPGRWSRRRARGCQRAAGGGPRRRADGPDHPGVDRDRPLRAFALVGVAAHLVEDPHPGAGSGPAAMPVVDGLPVPVLGRHVPPRHPTAGSPQHAVDHGPVIGPPSPPASCLAGQQRLQPSPFLVGQIVAIKHGSGLPHPRATICGTRPSPGAGATFAAVRHTLAADPATGVAALRWLLASWPVGRAVRSREPVVADVGARNSAHLMRPADIRGAVRRVGRVVGRCQYGCCSVGGGRRGVAWPRLRCGRWWLKCCSNWRSAVVACR